MSRLRRCRCLSEGGVSVRGVSWIRRGAEAPDRGGGRARVLDRPSEGSMDREGVRRWRRRRSARSEVCFWHSLTTHVGKAAERGGLRTEGLVWVQFCCKKAEDVPED